MTGMMPPIIFLDIDGVLVPFGDNVPMYPVFLPRCVEALKSILNRLSPSLNRAQITDTRASVNLLGRPRPRLSVVSAVLSIAGTAGFIAQVQK